MIMTSFNESSGSSSIGGGGIALGKWRKNFYNNTAEDIADAIDFGVAKDLWSDQVGETTARTEINFSSYALSSTSRSGFIKFGYCAYRDTSKDIKEGLSSDKSAESCQDIYQCSNLYRIDNNRVILKVNKIQLIVLASTTEVPFLDQTLNAAKKISDTVDLTTQFFIIYFVQPTFGNRNTIGGFHYDKNENILYMDYKGTY